MKRLKNFWHPPLIDAKDIYEWQMEWGRKGWSWNVLQELIESNQVSAIDLRDETKIQEEIEKSKAVLRDIQKAKKHLSTFVREYYKFEDLF